MRHLRAIDGLRGSSEPLSSHQNSSYSRVITREGLSNHCSTRADLVAGLAPVLRGEGEPAESRVDQARAKAPRPVGDPFDLAAVLCGHDPCTEVGRADARRDFRVWDLLDQPGGDR